MEPTYAKTLLTLVALIVFAAVASYAIDKMANRPRAAQSIGCERAWDLVHATTKTVCGVGRLDRDYEWTRYDDGPAHVRCTAPRDVVIFEGDIDPPTECTAIRHGGPPFMSGVWCLSGDDLECYPTAEACATDSGPIVTDSCVFWPDRAMPPGFHCTGGAHAIFVGGRVVGCQR